MVDKEKPVNKALKDSEIKPSQIVNINFAQKNFEKYRVLLRIDQMAKQGQKMRTKKRNLTDFKKAHALEKEIELTKD